MIEGVDPRLGHQRKTLDLTGPCFSVPNFPVGKTANGYGEIDPMRFFDSI
jgi:hypothetical protein